MHLGMLCTCSACMHVYSNWSGGIPMEMLATLWVAMGLLGLNVQRLARQNDMHIVVWCGGAGQ